MAKTKKVIDYQVKVSGGYMRLSRGAHNIECPYPFYKYMDGATRKLSRKQTIEMLLKLMG